MTRLSGKSETGYQLTDLAAAAERLGRFEDLCDDLQREQEEIAERLEHLRQEGRTRSYSYKELAAQKAIGQMLLSRLRSYHLL